MSDKAFPRWFRADVTGTIRRFDSPTVGYFENGLRKGEQTVFTVLDMELGDSVWQELTQAEAEAILKEGK